MQMKRVNRVRNIQNIDGRDYYLSRVTSLSKSHFVNLSSQLGEDQTPASIWICAISVSPLMTFKMPSWIKVRMPSSIA